MGGSDPSARELHEFSARIVTFGQFLARREKAALAKLFPEGRPAKTVTYHDSCHHRDVLHAEGDSRELVRMALGGEITEMTGPASCCGFAGTFCVDHAEVSEVLTADKGTRLVALCDILTDRVQAKRNELKQHAADQVAVPDANCFVGFDAYEKVIASGVDVVPRVVVSGGDGKDGGSTSANVMQGLLTMLLSERFGALQAEGDQRPRSVEAEALREAIWQDIQKKTQAEGKGNGKDDVNAKK